MTSSVRENLIKDLKGKTIRIRDLGKILPAWPQGVNPEVEKLRNQVEVRLDTLFEGSRRAKLKAVDPAWFGAAWWPYAGFEQVWVGTWMFIWLFAWDDETDSMELSSIARDPQMMNKFRLRTSNFVRQSLGFAVSEEDAALGPLESNPLITSFGIVGEALMASYTRGWSHLAKNRPKRLTAGQEQRKRVLDHIEFFLDMTAVEQDVALGATLPTVDQYIRRRMGTSAVGMCLEMTEYCYDMQLPPSIVQSKDLKRLHDETNIIIAVVNDILSVHKEVKQGQVDSLIPLLFHEYKDAQTATEVGLAIVKTAVENFEIAASSLLHSAAGDDTLTRDVGRFIDGCRYACTANSVWSLRSKRYGLGNARLDGVIEITV